MQNHVFTLAYTCKLAGVTDVIFCPGSRCAPLIQAFTHESGFNCHSVVDERSAAYIAIGIAQQTRKPVVLICTSGTAAANFYPAVAEAFYQQIPLLVLTADRPPELLNQQDGQMIDQKNLYGQHVRFYRELPCYVFGKEQHHETAAIVTTALDRALFPAPGPVHLNVPLREPLYASQPHIPKVPARSIPKRSLPSIPVPNQLLEDWKRFGRKLILVGQHPVDTELYTALRHLSTQPDVVIVCDILSNQFPLATAPLADTLLLWADDRIRKNLQPDLIISLGGPVLSKSLKLWLQSFTPHRHYRIDTLPYPIDTYRHGCIPIKAPAVNVLKKLPESSHADTVYQSLWTQLNELVSYKSEEFLDTHPGSELYVTSELLNHIPDACTLQIGNSSIIRYVSYLGALNPSWTLYGNRGTSGIDGCTSTAVGAAIAQSKMTVLLSGDLGFLYDRNGLWIRPLPENLRIVVINNGGGGIFSLIDGPEHMKQHQHYLTTPHRQNLKSIASEYQLDYYFCAARDIHQAPWDLFFKPTGKPALLEIQTDMRLNASVFKSFKNINLF